MEINDIPFSMESRRRLYIDQDILFKAVEQQHTQKLIGCAKEQDLSLDDMSIDIVEIDIYTAIRLNDHISEVQVRIK